MGLIEDWLRANADEIPEPESEAYMLFARRVAFLRRVYREHFADTTTGNPGEFQAVMIMLAGGKFDGS
mgnify:CR=1 FL=1